MEEDNENRRDESGEESIEVYQWNMPVNDFENED